VKAQIRGEGRIKLCSVPVREITAMAEAYVLAHRELIAEARARVEQWARSPQPRERLSILPCRAMSVLAPTAAVDAARLHASALAPCLRGRSAPRGFPAFTKPAEVIASARGFTRFFGSREQPWKFSVSRGGRTRLSPSDQPSKKHGAADASRSRTRRAPINPGHARTGVIDFS
jgi:hypothetical protein